MIPFFNFKFQHSYLLILWRHSVSMAQFIVVEFYNAYINGLAIIFNKYMYSVLLRINSLILQLNNSCKTAKSEWFIHYTTVNKHVTLDIFHLMFVYGHCTNIIEQGAIAIFPLFARAVLVASLICIKDNVRRSELWRCWESIPFARKNPYPYYTHWSGPPAEVYPRFTLQPQVVPAPTRPSHAPQSLIRARTAAYTGRVTNIQSARCAVNHNFMVPYHYTQTAMSGCQPRINRSCVSHWIR